MSGLHAEFGLGEALEHASACLDGGWMAKQLGPNKLCHLSALCRSVAQALHSRVKGRCSPQPVGCWSGGMKVSPKMSMRLRLSLPGTYFRCQLSVSSRNRLAVSSSWWSCSASVTLRK